MSLRYQGGHGSLAINVHGDETEQGEAEDMNPEEDEEVKEDVEEVIDHLLQGVKDQDTVVR